MSSEAPPPGGYAIERVGTLVEIDGASLVGQENLALQELNDDPNDAEAQEILKLVQKVNHDQA